MANFVSSIKDGYRLHCGMAGIQLAKEISNLTGYPVNGSLIQLCKDGIYNLVTVTGRNTLPYNNIRLMANATECFDRDTFTFLNTLTDAVEVENFLVTGARHLNDELLTQALLRFQVLVEEFPEIMFFYYGDMFEVFSNLEWNIFTLTHAGKYTLDVVDTGVDFRIKDWERLQQKK